MMLADLGADVLRVDRAGEVEAGRDPAADAIGRGRRSIAVDLKHEAGAEVVLRLVERADVLIEGFRPGVAERLGIGPEPCLERNPRLVYGRITGWGQTGPMAAAPGHDLNYIALTGALAAIGAGDAAPTIPLNLVGDFGGGGMLLAVGVLAAVLQARESGRGQVVDAAMTDGSALLMTMMYGFLGAGQWQVGRGRNLLDGGVPFYDVYKTSDGGYISVGCLEPKFYRALLEVLALDDIDPAAQMDAAGWPEVRRRLAETFATKTRDDWESILAGTEVCAAPVMDMSEAPTHPHNVARGTFGEIDGVLHPMPAPRVSETAWAVPGPPSQPGEHTESALPDWGFSAAETAALQAADVIRQR
jgi:alpha-methylacyl-CoA racemase